MSDEYITVITPKTDQYDLVKKKISGEKPIDFSKDGVAKVLAEAIVSQQEFQYSDGPNKPEILEWEIYRFLTSKEAVGTIVSGAAQNTLTIWLDRRKNPGIDKTMLPAFIASMRIDGKNSDKQWDDSVEQDILEIQERIAKSIVSGNKVSLFL